MVNPRILILRKRWQEFPYVVYSSYVAKILLPKQKNNIDALNLAEELLLW